MKTLFDYYREATTNEDQLKISIIAIAERRGCNPLELHEIFINEFKIGNATKSDLEEVAKAWAEKKIAEGNFFGIKPENTSAAILEKWTIDYKNENF